MYSVDRLSRTTGISSSPSTASSPRSSVSSFSSLMNDWRNTAGPSNVESFEMTDFPRRASVTSIGSNWSFGTEYNSGIQNLTSARNPRITQMQFDTGMTFNHEMTPATAKETIAQWNRAFAPVSERFPIGGLQSAENAASAAGKAGSFFKGLNTNTVLGVNAALGQMTGMAFNAGYDREVSEAQNYATNNLRFGAGAAINQQNYVNAYARDAAQSKAAMNIGSSFGPVGSLVAAAVNSSRTVSPNLNTSYSTGGNMVNGTSDASASTSTAQ